MVEQPLVELIGHVVAKASELLIERGDGDHASGVAAGAHRNFDVRDLLTEQLVGFRLKTKAVHLVEIGVRTQGDDQVEPLVRSDRGQAVKAGDADDSQPQDADGICTR